MHRQEEGRRFEGIDRDNLVWWYTETFPINFRRAHSPSDYIPLSEGDSQTSLYVVVSLLRIYPLRPCNHRGRLPYEA